MKPYLHAKSWDSSLYANYVLMAFAFFLPISHHITSIMMDIMVILLLLSGNLKERFREVTRDKIVIAFILMYSIHAFWMIGSEHLHIALLKLKEFMYLLYIIPIAMVLQKEFVLKVLGSFLVAMFFSELVSYGMSFGIVFPFVKVGIAANVPFMEFYTQYGTVLSITLGIILYQLLTNETLTKGMKLFSLFFFISASTNIFIVASRIGYGLYAISIVTVLMLVYKRQVLKLALYGGMVIILGYLVAYSSSPLFRIRMAAAINDVQLMQQGHFDTSLGARAAFHYYSYDVIKEHLFFGVGTGDHIALVEHELLTRESDKQEAQGIARNIQSGHNASLHSEYLDTFVQFGFIGLLVFFNLFYQIYRYAQKDHFLKMIQYLMVVLMLFESIGTVIFIQSDVGMVFMFLMAVTINLPSNRWIASSKPPL
ncbi:MAG: O-antigen ligase family protein [Sulfuricurvum sp.]